MTTKQIGYSLSILVVLAIIFGIWTSFTKPVAPVAVQETHVLPGTLTEQGEYAYTEDKDYYTIKATYPAKTPLEPAADAKARATIEQALAQEIADFKQNSKLDSLTAEDIQIQGLSAERRYALDMQYKAYVSPGTVSYAYQIYVDTLGAHPNGYYKTFVFDQEGNRIKIADLFDSQGGWLAELSRLVTAEVTKQMAEITGKGNAAFDLYPEGLAANPDNFQNFYLDGDTLGILIPPYQVAAYAAGSFEVRIPLSQLSNILKKE